MIERRRPRKLRSKPQEDASTKIAPDLIETSDGKAATPSSSSSPLLQCRWCGEIHGQRCASVKAIDFYPDGVTVKRVEFVDGRRLMGGFTWIKGGGSGNLGRSDED
jgi:hypothetical protein